MKAIYLFIAAAIACLLYSCSTPIVKMDAFTVVNRTTTESFFTEEFYGKYDDKDSVIANDMKYMLYPMRIQTEISSEAQLTTEYDPYSFEASNTGNPHVTKTRIKNKPLWNHYYFIFKNGKFLYSGFLYELLRNQNPEIRRIGITISQNISSED